MLYTIYKTTNTINGKIYIGAHRTKSLDDGYIGSGHRLRVALKKYGRASFTKEILFVFDNATEMSAKEAELVTREFVDREDTYNLVPGGYQGDSFYQTRKNITPEMMSDWGQKGNDAQKALAAANPHYRDASRENGRRQTALLNAGGWKQPDWTGRRHSPDSLRKMKDTARERGLNRGERNSQHGTAWVSKLGENPKKIKMSELGPHLEAGWKRGRKP